MLQEILHNILANMFKPLLLFFMLGLLVPILRISFEFPKGLYESLTLYLLLAIGWHGGEELALLSRGDIVQAAILVGLGLVTNTAVGLTAYEVLRRFPKMRPMDAATIAGYYGSDSAGTFVTCMGVLTTAGIAYEAYSPILLAAMEIPGCLVALYLTSSLRRSELVAPMPLAQPAMSLAGAGYEDIQTQASPMEYMTQAAQSIVLPAGGVVHGAGQGHLAKAKAVPVLSKELLHEVLLNPSIYLLVGGLIIGFVSRSQGVNVVQADDALLNNLFQGLLCFFLFEMGITAAKRLADVRLAGWRLVVFALIAPNVFATFGMLMLTALCVISGFHFALGTFVIFGVLCGSASYIALPAVQRMAIPESSPTLPLIASLGVTFTYNVTIGISVYISVAKLLTNTFLPS